jgi:hypothetical protein
MQCKHISPKLLATAYTDTLLYVTDILCQFPPLFQRYSRANRKLLTLLDGQNYVLLFLTYKFLSLFRELNNLVQCKRFGYLTLEDWTYRLSRNIGKGLPLFAA